MKIRKKFIGILITSIISTTSFAALAFNADKIIKIEPENKIEQISTPTNAIKATTSNAEPKNTFTGFKTIKDKTVYFKNGKQAFDCFRIIDGELYRFDEDGYMITGWYLYEPMNDWYYFSEDGVSQEGWIYDEDHWYYLENHEYIKGWKEIITNDGEAYWFYFGEDGIMYSNTYTPDGYFVNEDGMWEEENTEDKESFVWDKELVEKAQLSGLVIADHPVEFYMLCIAGETSGLSNLSAVKNGDKGCAYGICQLDYRYDLVGFMKFAYEKHPDLWTGFENYLGYKNGNPELKRNNILGNIFINAMNTDYETAIADQLEYMSLRYWNDFENQMNAVGFQLDERHIAVSSALFSVNVNCGPQANIFIKYLSPDMSDEEMIQEIYHLRNTVFAKQKVGSTLKGTTKRYKKSEPQMALDLLYGYTTVDSNINYGGGVEWHGNPFSQAITTVSTNERIIYDEEPEIEETQALEKTQEIQESETTEEIENKEIQEIEEIIEETIESINETEEQIETVESKEGVENIIQLKNGLWVNRTKYGPGYEYMETEESLEGQLEPETEQETLEK